MSSKKLDELMDQYAAEFALEEKPESKENEEKEKMKEFFFGKKSCSGGKCPVCGEVGDIHLSTFICKYHGAFT